VDVTGISAGRVHEVNIKRRIRDVEELEEGIAVNLWICLAEVADRPGL